MSDKQEFFILDETYSDYAEAIELDNKVNIRVCSECRSRFVTRLSDLNVKFEGKKIADFYSVSNYNIISKKMFKSLNDAKVTGFSTRSICIKGWYDKKGNELDINACEFREIIVDGRCGYLRKKEGSLVEKCQECDAKNYKKQDEVDGLYVDINEWDKSDIFYFKNWEGVIIITEKVKEILEKSKLKNVSFVNVKDFRFD